MRKVVNNADVYNFWKPTCGNEECDTVAVHPDFYEESGTPICMCGYDMEYTHTEVNEN